MLLARRAAPRALFALGLAAATTVALGVAGHAGTTLTFDASADASAQHLLVHVPGAPLTDDLVDAGGNRAVARVNSLGTSQTRAAAPHPGDLAISAPGLVGGLAPLPVPLPAYPLVADSSFPSTPASDSSQGPLILTAASTADTSKGAADVQPATAGAAGATSHVDIVTSADKATATASTTVHGFSAGPLVIDGLRSTATVTRTVSGVTRKAELTAAEITVAGTGLTVDSRGITLAGTAIPLTAVAPVVDALKAAGIRLSYVAATETKDSISAPNLAVQLTMPVPPNPALAVPSVTYTVLLGQASATVHGSAFEDQVGGGSTGGVDPGTTSGSAGSTAGGTSTGDPTGLTGTPSLPSTSGGDGVNPVPPPSVPGTSTSGGSSPQLAQQASVTPVAWSATFYLALAGAAVLVVVVLTLVRYLGVRYP
ncbi:MAG: hypothetical protein JWO22_1185 [Frankiales bacterium]|nr:hypothetical protein [Frankiales bacterium]